MRVIILALALIVALLSFVQADPIVDGILSRLANAERNQQILLRTLAVTNVMRNYTFNVDHLVAVKANNAITSHVFQTALNNVMATFCPAPHFNAWINYFDGELVANVTTYNGTVGVYTNLPNILVNISNHMLTSEIVTFSADLNTATFVSKLYHPTINSAYQTDPPANVWSIDVGKYSNTFLFLNGSPVPCMSQFIATGTFVSIIPGAANIPTLQDLTRI